MEKRGSSNLRGMEDMNLSKLCHYSWVAVNNLFYKSQKSEFLKWITKIIQNDFYET